MRRELLAGNASVNRCGERKQKVGEFNEWHVVDVQHIRIIQLSSHEMRTGTNSSNEKGDCDKFSTNERK